MRKQIWIPCQSGDGFGAWRNKSVAAGTDASSFSGMKNEQIRKVPPTWYKKILAALPLVNKNPELAVYLNKEESPEYRKKVRAKLVAQSQPNAPSINQETVTPEKLGRHLGQKCANLYALKDPKTLAAAKQEAQRLKQLRTQRHLPGVSSELHALRINEMVVKQFKKDLPRFEKKVQAAFQTALAQPNHQEAVAFFKGFAKGLEKPGLKDGKLAGETKATPLQMKMFLHTEQAAEMRSVDDWREFLLKNGETEETLGDPERLRKFCFRIRYAPGKKKL